MRALLCLSLLLALAACGGGGSDGESFTKRALAICEEANDRVLALGAPESFPETQLYARRAKDAVADEIGDLNDLTPPAERADAFEVYLVALEERQRLLGRLADAADETSMDSVRETGSQITALGDTAREHASAAGIAACEPR